MLNALSVRRISVMTLACAAWALAPGAWAQQSKSGAAEPGEVRAWLLRIHQAASQSNFQGTFVVSGAGAVSSARIAHFCDGNNQFERIESLDGQTRHVFRHNDVVQTVWPDSRVVRIEQRDFVMSFPALLQAGDDRIADYYDVHAQGGDRVAGHEARVLWVKPKDAHRYGYRLWADKASGLLLRADVLGERGELLESSAFSEVSIGVKPHPDSVLSAMKRLDGYRVFRPQLTPTRLEAEGWQLRATPPGFRQVSCVKRSMDGVGPGERDDDGPQVVQSIFSDGLTHVSVFIEPFNSRRHIREMLASVGATQTLMRRHGQWWLTVVGDVPAATLRSFADNLEPKK
jgi:sigma-E factor negative regulatory protein RseB